MRQRSRKRAAIRVGQIAIRQALSLVPVLGTGLAVGFEMVTSVAEEYSPDEPISQAEVVELLGVLSRRDLVEIVDEELSRDTGASQIANLTPSEQSAVRRHLLQLPTRLDAVMANVRADEQRQAAQARNEAEQRSRERIERLRRDLDRYVDSRRWRRAHSAADGLIRAGAATPEVRRVERFTYERGKASGVSAALVLTLLLFGWLPTGLVFVGDHETALLARLAVAATGLTFVTLVLHRRLARPVRNLLLMTTLVCTMSVGLYASYLVR